MSSKEYYVVLPDDAKGTKEDSEVFWLADLTHAIVLFSACFGLLVPSLFGASAGTSLMVGGSAVIVAVILSLWLTGAYKRKVFMIGYGVVAVLAVVVAYQGYIYPAM